MTEAEKRAQSIYDLLVSTSAERPKSFRTAEQMRSETAAWKQNNPAFQELALAEPEVLLAFLQHSFEWLRAEAHLAQNYTACNTLAEGIQLAFSGVPKPLPGPLVEYLFGEYYGEMGSMAHMFFPVRLLILSLTRDQVTDGIRTKLRQLYLRLAPSANGIIEPETQKFRDELAARFREEGDLQPDPGRGPWSQIVFDEVKGNEEITRAGWEALLEHCRNLEQAVPGTKWKKRSRELISILGDEQVYSAMLRWLALGPTPGQPSEARSPIEDSAYQKGVVWCLTTRDDREVAVAIADFGIACLRKVPLLGAVSQKVGFTCAQALGSMQCSEAVTQLTRMRAKIKYTVARRLIEKSLKQAAERSGMTVQSLEDISVGHYGLNEHGESKIELGDSAATVHLADDGSVAALWHDANGKPVKSAPSHIKNTFPKETRAVAMMVKELEQSYAAQRFRLESSFLSPEPMPVAHWRKYFIEHPLLGFLGRKLIWIFRNDAGWERAGMWSAQGIIDSSGNSLDLNPAQTARLWHPLASEPEEVQKWRQRIFAAKIHQPFRQAFREFYQLTDDERQTKTYSNRFAGIVLRQHQFASLCRARGWEYRLMGAHFDGANVPTKKFNSWKMRAEMYVDLPSDRVPALLQSALGEQSGSGINLFLNSDQVRFYREGREVAMDDVPAVLYSETMRDVDLFTAVSAVGEDESWADEGDRGTGFVREDSNVEGYSGIIALRHEILTLALPQTRIYDRCTLHKTWLEVRGELGTYRMDLAWGGAVLFSGSILRRLRIPRKVLDEVSLDPDALSVEFDSRSETILRKAYVLADDWKIESPDLIKQLMPE